MRRFTENRLVLASHNKGKLAEIIDLLAPYSVRAVFAGDLGLPEPAETETTFVGNARIKAHAAALATGLPSLADDSGITVNALGGSPGVYTADWAETPQGRDFHMAMDRVWAELETVSAPYPRLAQFRSTLALAWPDGHDEVFEGVLQGEVVWPKRGTNGHGYDPIFQPLGQPLTFAEMDAAAKNAISHRGRAFAQMIAGCFA
jgi:XTP/dITP diphosphohydrolase